jgi:acetoacetate decarboxylase
MFMLQVCVFACSSQQGHASEVRTADLKGRKHQVAPLNMPLQSPLVRPGNLVYENNEAFTVTFTTTPEAARALVPEPLEPTANVVIAFAAKLDWVGEEPGYSEVALFVPASYTNSEGEMTSGIYTPYMYVDDGVALAGGREIWGYPKKGGLVSYERNASGVTASLSRRGDVLIEMSIKFEDPGTVGPADFVILNQKVIPSVTGKWPPDVMQLTSHIARQVVHEASVASGSITLTGGPLDPIDEIPVLSVVAAAWKTYDMELLFGEVLCDYVGTSNKCRR